MRNNLPLAIAIAIIFVMESGVLAQQPTTSPQTPSEQVARVAVDDASKKSTTTESVDTKSTSSPAPSTDPDGWQFEIAPYVWLAGLDGDLRVRNNTVHVEQSASDLLKQVDFAFATKVEAGKGRWKFIVDENYMNLGATGAGPLGQVTDVQPTLNIFEFGGSYAAVVVPNKDSTSSVPLPPSFSLEILGGGRYTHFGLGIDRPNLSVEGSRNIVDAFVGNRLKLRPHPAVTLIGKYSVGAGGSHFAWSAAGLVDFRWKPGFSMWGGYQVLDMDADHGTNTIGFNGRMGGLIVGFSMYR